MLMVIFGAGASYDSSPEFPPPQPGAGNQNFSLAPAPPGDSREQWRPPLGNQLFLDPHGVFGAIVEDYPKLHPIMAFLRRPPGNRSVEEQLELYRDEAINDEERRRQFFSIRYYLHRLMDKVSQEWLTRTNYLTNYATLIDQIRHLNTARDPVCLISFNYDLLLDRALLSIGYEKPPTVERQCSTHPVFKLFKPHGSVDWARLVDRSRGLRLDPRQLIAQGDKIELSDAFVQANATYQPDMFRFESPIVPAISVPVQTKTADTFEWPPEHRIYLEELLPNVRKILIIGWQGKEAHFLRLLTQKLPSDGVTQITHLQVVGKDRTESEKVSKQFSKDIGRYINHLDFGPTQGGFSAFVREDLVNFCFK